jgi:flagellar hook assembly protein FlgD
VSVLGSEASGVTLTDDLPKGLDPKTVVFVTSPSGTVTGTTISWVLGTLKPGTTTVSFSVQVEKTAEGDQLLRNVGHVTSPDAPPADATADATVRGDVQVTIGLYNSAGELVKTLAVKYMSNPVNDVTLLADAVLSSVGDSVTVVMGNDGRVLGAWNGTNKVGDLVANGTYYLKVDSVDAYGTTTSVTKQLTVNRPVSKVELKVYNEAGELVRTLYTETAGPIENVTDAHLTATTISPSQTGTGGTQTTAVMADDTLLAVWDGRDDKGQIVKNGQYYVEVKTDDGKGAHSTVDLPVSVLAANNGATTASVKPNVLTPMNPMGLIDGGSPGSTLTARIYRLNGDLVVTIQGAAGAGNAWWDSRGAAAGMYLVVVDVVNADGTKNGRLITKVLVRK